jgi:hypothetical protein
MTWCLCFFILHTSKGHPTRVEMTMMLDELRHSREEGGFLLILPRNGVWSFMKIALEQ